MKTYCIVYRTSGTASGRWHRSHAMPRQEAEEALAKIKAMGYRFCMLVDYQRSVSVGLPEG